MLSSAVAVFVKTIGLSPVKSRLAASIGRENAENFYRKCVLQTQKVLAQVSESNRLVKPVWAIAEKEAMENDFYRGWLRYWQGEGGLGSRLNTIEEKLFSEGFLSVLFYGTDSPHISANEILLAYDMFAECDVVIGPAEDGGFYLLLTKVALGPDVWLNIEYSSDKTLDQLIERCRSVHPELKIGFLPKQFDIDTIEEMNRAIQICPALKP